jgi:hypothetical protein
MLGKELRKKLNERKWADIIRKDSNPTQTWHRLRKQANLALNDLALLARKLPDDKQDEIFDDKIKGFIESILVTDRIRDESINDPYFDTPVSNNLGYRRTKLAALVVKECIDLCVFQYKQLFRDTPSLNKPIVEHLERSKSMCDDISYKLNLTMLELKSREDEITYLFEWNKIGTREKGRFAEFLRIQTGSTVLEIDDIGFTPNTITCNYKMDTFRTGKAYIKLNDENTCASIALYYYFKKKWRLDKEFQILVKKERGSSDGHDRLYNRLRLYLRGNTNR